MYIGIKAVRPLKNFKLLVFFENGEQRIFDMKPYLDKGIFAELKNRAIFNSVRISFDTVEWPNGADICPETVYHESVSVKKKIRVGTTNSSK
jgi:hypothetical protein